MRVIGIRDRDYEKEQVHDRIFFYDYSCWEMMIVSFEDLFENIYYEYYNGNAKPNELLNVLLNNIKHISVVRRYSSNKKLEINFRGISM